ncbi:MAG: methyltransferase domain-containing protein [Ktedonobacteraceae bacterium]|nr:methyltransferase domain-containing protein [Ktedonobacteraceae bacterium]
MANAPYMLPKDEKEINRLDFQHYMLRYALRGNFLAPVDRPESILDVGCGTGRWMLEMAADFPQANIVGFDLNVPALDGSVIAFPSNCTFRQGNLLAGLPFSASSFDFVHQRLLAFALPVQHWPVIIQELVRVTRPGGWIELVEVDPLFKNQGPATRRMLDLIVQACGKRGIDLSIAHKLEALVKATGVIDVQSRVISIPVGDWGGRLGTMAKADFYAGNKTIAPLVATATGATMEEYYRLADAWMQECEQYQTYCNFHVIYGLRQAQ